MSAKSGQFQGERIYLHPSGLSKARRKIFESWILKEGGLLVADDPKQGDVAVVEDKLLEGATLEAAIQKFDPEVLVVGLSWLSSCIEHSKRVSEAPFVLRRMSEGVKGQNKRSLHNLSDSDESDPEQRGSKQPRDFASKPKHSLSDSDEDEDTANKDTVEKNTSPETEQQGKSSAPPNGHIAAELGELLKLKISHYQSQLMLLFHDDRETGKGLQRQRGPVESKNLFQVFEFCTPLFTINTMHITFFLPYYQHFTYNILPFHQHYT